MFDTGKLLDSLKTVKLSFTESELNNLVYLGLKYACSVENPPNQYIEGVIYRIGENRSLDGIVETVVECARELAKKTHTEFDMNRRKMRLCEIIGEFMQMPEDVRNDMGTDSEDTGPINSSHKN